MARVQTLPKAEVSASIELGTRTTREWSAMHLGVSVLTWGIEAVPCQCRTKTLILEDLIDDDKLRCQGKL